MFLESIKLEYCPSFLTYFRPVLLFFIPCKRQKSLVILLFPGGIKPRHWKEMGQIMLKFTKFKKTFFQLVTFSNFLRIFQWISRESLLHRVHGVHKQAGLGAQINTLQTQGVEMTLI